MCECCSSHGKLTEVHVHGVSEGENFNKLRSLVIDLPGVLRVAGGEGSSVVTFDPRIITAERVAAALAAGGFHAHSH